MEEPTNAFFDAALTLELKPVSVDKATRALEFAVVLRKSRRVFFMFPHNEQRFRVRSHMALDLLKFGCHFKDLDPLWILGSPFAAVQI